MAAKRGIGLFPKLLLAVLAPILLGFIVLGSMVFYSWNLGSFQINSIKDMGAKSFSEMRTFYLTETRTSLGGLVEKKIREKVQDVGKQIEIFLKSNPKSKMEDLLKDPRLGPIAVQKIGEADYTSVYNVQGINQFHMNPQQIGIDFRQQFKEHPDILKIVETGCRETTSGYYDWRDRDGQIHSKYLFVTPIKDTDLIIVADTSLEEFSKPAAAVETRMRQIERRYTEEYEKRFKAFSLTILITFVVVMIIIFFFSRTLIHPIRYLSEVADKISMGDLDTPIKIKTKGEVGLLAESLDRMRLSVKAAIERLQRRKKE